MSHEYRATLAERNTAATILDKAHALPARGQHVGTRAAEGPPIAATWDGNGRVPFGWSSYQAHRDGDAVWLPEPETASKLARLTPQERAALAAIRAAATAHEPEQVPAEGRAR